MKGRILITDPVHQILIDGLQQLGYEVDYLPETNQAAVLQIISQYVGLIINSKISADMQLIDRGLHLKFIGRLGSGLEVIDQVHAERKGIIFFNSPEGNRDSVAEHTLGMMLCLLNHIHIANWEVHNRKWLREQNRGTELKGKTIGIIGFGNTGKAVAEKLSGFGVQIRAYDKYVHGYGNGLLREVQLQEIFEQADIVTLHVQLTPETANMVNKDFISRFSKPVYLVNTSRGGVLSAEGLIWGLEQGKILGAALDVLEQEKLEAMDKRQIHEFDQLASFNNVLFTPHIAGWTYESKKRIAEVVLNKVETIDNAGISFGL